MRFIINILNLQISKSQIANSQLKNDALILGNLQICEFL